MPENNPRPGQGNQGRNTGQQGQSGAQQGTTKRQQDDVTRTGRQDDMGRQRDDQSGDLRSGQRQTPSTKPDNTNRETRGDANEEGMESDDEPIRAGDVAVQGDPATKHDIAAASEASPRKGSPPMYPREVQPRSR